VHLNRIFAPFFTTKPIGKGTTFSVWLPVEAKATVPPEPTS
jgi:signal transduction histidine kinase